MSGKAELSVALWHRGRVLFGPGCNASIALIPREWINRPIGFGGGGHGLVGDTWHARARVTRIAVAENPWQIGWTLMPIKGKRRIRCKKTE